MRFMHHLYERVAEMEDVRLEVNDAGPAGTTVTLLIHDHRHTINRDSAENAAAAALDLLEHIST